MDTSNTACRLILGIPMAGSAPVAQGTRTTTTDEEHKEEEEVEEVHRCECRANISASLLLIRASQYQHQRRRDTEVQHETKRLRSKSRVETPHYLHEDSGRWAGVRDDSARSHSMSPQLGCFALAGIFFELSELSAESLRQVARTRKSPWNQHRHARL